MVRGGYNIEGDDGNVDGNGDAGLRRPERLGVAQPRATAVQLPRQPAKLENEWPS